MNWSDISPLLAKQQPELAAALQGPQDSAIGIIIATAIGKGDCPTPGAVYEALQAKPTLIEQLAVLDIPLLLSQLPTHKEKEEQPEPDNTSDTANAHDDTLSARNMQMLALKKGKGDFTNRFAVVVFVCSILLMSMMLFLDVGPINDNMRFYVLGFLQAVMMAIITFYFGSTRWHNANAGNGK